MFFSLTRCDLRGLADTILAVAVNVEADFHSFFFASWEEADFVFHTSVFWSFVAAVGVGVTQGCAALHPGLIWGRPGGD